MQYTQKVKEGKKVKLKDFNANYCSGIEEELAAETLKLAYIREIKSRRFKTALKSVIIFYSWVIITFALLRNCAGG